MAPKMKKAQREWSPDPEFGVDLGSDSEVGLLIVETVNSSARQ